MPGTLRRVKQFFIGYHTPVLLDNLLRRKVVLPICFEVLSVCGVVENTDEGNYPHGGGTTVNMSLEVVVRLCRFSFAGKKLFTLRCARWLHFSHHLKM